MSYVSRRHFTSQQKAEVARRHLTGTDAVSELRLAKGSVA